MFYKVNVTTFYGTEVFVSLPLSPGAWSSSLALGDLQLQ